MADSYEKTEEPTPKKIQESRKKGQVARSRELSTALVLIASALSFLLMGSYIAEALFAVMQRTFQLSRDETYDTTHMFQAWGNAFSQVSMPVLFYMLIAMVAGIYGSIALGGYNFTWQSASPKASKISPIAGFKRMFGVEGLVELLKAIGKFFVIAGAAYLALLLFRDEALHLDQELFPLNLFHALDMIEWAFLMLCCALIPIVAIDVPYQSHKHNKEMNLIK